MGRVYALAMHTDYRCRQTGVCCRAGWDVPVEPAPLARIRAAGAAGRLALPEGALLEGAGLPEGAAAMLGRATDGACLFYDGTTRLCRVHSAQGSGALPVACRQFPRIALRDPRGTFITLSHFCPTAAAVLWDDVPLVIRQDPPAFPDADYEGLDASGELPPLLRPDVLMDFEGYAAWETHMVGRLATPGAAAAALDALRADAATLAQWRPDVGPLALAVATLTLDTGPAAPDPELLYAEARAAIPDDLRPPEPSAPPPELDAPELQPPIRRFLAAHAFASWCAYQGRGVRTIVRSLDATLAVLRAEAGRLVQEGAAALGTPWLIEAVRLTDLRLCHQASREALARAWSAADAPATGRTRR